MINQDPVIGAAIWCIQGKATLPEKIRWLIDNGFSAVSFSQGIMWTKGSEREEAARIIRDVRMSLTYHGNVHHVLVGGTQFNTEFTERMLNDVIWWHENTNGVVSCCSDCIKTEKDGLMRFDSDMNKELVHIAISRLQKYGIRAGLENSSSMGTGAYCSLEQIRQFNEECGLMQAGMLLDAGHANVHVRNDGAENETEIGDFVRKIPCDILEVHFSDNHGTSDEHNRLGDGNLDIESLLKALSERCSIPILTIEVGADMFDCAKKNQMIISRDAIASAWNMFHAG